VSVQAVALAGAVAGQAGSLVLLGAPGVVEPVPAVDVLPALLVEPALCPAPPLLVVESPLLSVEPPHAAIDARPAASRQLIPYRRAFMGSFSGS
jgi:hypothetical protein